MKKLFILSLFILCKGFVNAQDRMFAYTYQSNVLNKGTFDLEFHNELRTGKVGAYSPYVFGQHLDQRFEFEAGVCNKVQAAFYFNSELFVSADTTSAGLNQELAISFSNEWKLKLSDPVANGIGCALYEEFEFGGNNVESETKLILDKQFKKDLIAFNITGIYEIEHEVERENGKTEAKWEKSSPMEFYLGYMHFFKGKTGVGFEAKNNNDINQADGWINSVLFAGPAFHFSAGSFFANLTAVAQLANLHKTELAPGSMDLNDFEAMEVRLVVGYNF